MDRVNALAPRLGLNATEIEAIRTSYEKLISARTESERRAAKVETATEAEMDVIIQPYEGTALLDQFYEELNQVIGGERTAEFRPIFESEIISSNGAFGLYSQSIKVWREPSGSLKYTYRRTAGYNQEFFIVRNGDYVPGQPNPYADFFQELGNRHN